MKLKEIILIVFSILGITTATLGQKVETFIIDGNTNYGTKAIPKEIAGKYKYDIQKNPLLYLMIMARVFFKCMM